MTLEESIQGHWVRAWIKAPGFEDHDTRVHWLQAGRDFADVRVPMDRPDLTGAHCLAELPAEALAQLAKAEGFAGHVTLDGSHCTWHREINWHGTPDAADIGDISFDAAGRMIETGVHADYTELWVQNATTTPHARRFSGSGYSGLLVACGGVAVLGLGRVDKPAAAPHLASLAQGLIPEDLDAFFDGLHAVCRIENDAVIATLATQPFCEDRPVLTLQKDAVIWHRVAFDGAMDQRVLAFETADA